MLKAKGIYKNYGNLSILKGIDLEIKTGEIVCIVGSSGAGKTTLLQILGTLDQADSGEIIHLQKMRQHLMHKISNLIAIQ